MTIIYFFNEIYEKRIIKCCDHSITIRSDN